MTSAEKNLLRDKSGSGEPRLSLRSETRIDTGRWGRRSPLWLCVMQDELITLAIGRRYHFDRISLADCPATHYNPATGELVIEPGETLRFNRIKIPPRDALRILDLITHNHKETHV